MAFKNKVVIVTASVLCSTSGIGQDTAVRFARESALVVIHGRSEEGLEETKKLMEKHNVPARNIHSVMGEIQSIKTQQELIEGTIRKFGRIDVLVNNAAILMKPNTDPFSIETYEYVFDINLKSVISLTEMVIPHLAKTNGNVVNISAATSQRASSSMHFYSMSKAALDQYTRSAALLHACKGIRVNSVNPGMTESSFVTRHSALKAIASQASKAFISIIPLGRSAKACEIAEVVLFVASERASYVTGSIVPVDGGILAGFPISRFVELVSGKLMRNIVRMRGCSIV